MEHVVHIRLLGVLTAALLAATVSGPMTANGEVVMPTRSAAAAGAPAAGPVELVAAPAIPPPVGWWDSVLSTDRPAADLAVAGRGYAVAGWLEPQEPDPVTQARQVRVVIATRQGDGSWSTAEPVSRPFFDSSGLDVATAGAGTGIVGWGTYDGGVSKQVWVSWLDGGTWTASERLGSGGSPSVAMSPSLTVLAWTDAEGFTRVLTRPALSDAIWDPLHIYAGGYQSVAAVGAGGAAAVVWGRSTRAGSRLRVLYRGNGDDSWKAPVSIPVRLYGEAGLAVTVDRAGRVLVVWTRSKSVYWTRRSLAGTWSKVAEVPGQFGHMGDYGGISATVNGRGRALAVWDSEDGSFAARYRPRTGFARAVSLSLDPGSRRGFTAATGDPLFAGDGATVVLGRDADRFALRWQATASQPWSPVDTITARRPIVADSFGRVTAALVWDEGGLYFHQFRLPNS